MANFATVQSLFVRLGLTEPEMGSVEEEQAAAALEDASNELRAITGQNIDAASGEITENVPVGGVINMPVVPVRAVSAVVDAETGEALEYRLDNAKQLVVHAPGGTRVTITCDYGWPTIPAEIARWTRVLAMAQLAAADAGNLGLSGGIASVGADDARVTFATNNGEPGQGATIPDDIAARLRNTYGALAATVEHRA